MCGRSDAAELTYRDLIRCENSINYINKNFWSYVKSKSNSYRIPELVSYGNLIKSDRKDQCKLFNQFFVISFPNLASILMLTKLKVPMRSMIKF